MDRQPEKLEKLKQLLQSGGPAIIAFSGGVDSAFLLHVASEVMDRVIALTALSPALPGEGLAGARAFAASLGVEHLCVNSSEIDDPRYSSNPINRCFYCKTELYRICSLEAKKRGIDTIYDGTNRDDLSEHRPGLKAAEENNIRSPMVEVGLGKDEIRELSRLRGIKEWQKPASPCLASRFPTGVKITVDRLKLVEEFESVLHKLGFIECRVRFHETIARIELDTAMIPLACDPKTRSKILEAGKKMGFKSVTLDLAGYRRGSAVQVST